MTRLRTWLVASLGLGAALASISVLALWHRSQHTSDWVSWGGSGGSYYELMARTDQVRFTLASNWPQPQPLQWRSSSGASSAALAVGQYMENRGFVGFDSARRTIAFGDPTSGVPMRRITVMCHTVAMAMPLLFMVFLLIGVWPLLRFLGRIDQRRERRRRRLCPACGYDVRATPGRCPECGSELSPH